MLPRFVMFIAAAAGWVVITFAMLLVPAAILYALAGLLWIWHLESLPVGCAPYLNSRTRIFQFIAWPVGAFISVLEQRRRHLFIAGESEFTTLDAAIAHARKVARESSQPVVVTDFTRFQKTGRGLVGSVDYRGYLVAPSGEVKAWADSWN